MLPRPLPAALALAALTAPCHSATAPQQPQPVRAVAAVTETVAELRDVTGNLRARSRARVAAAESGRVEKVAFDEGQSVAAGAVLVELDARRLRQDIAQARSELDVRKAQLGIEQATQQNAENDLAAYRAAESARKGSVSAITIRAAERDVAVAAARVKVAESEIVRVQSTIDRLAIRLEDTVVRAPFDGVVVTREVELGEWVDPGTAVAVVVSTGVVEAWIDVPESFSAAALTTSKDLRVRIDALGVQLAPTNVRAIPDVDPRSRRFMLVLDVDPAEHVLAPGMSVTAELPTGAMRALVRVPADAVLRDAGGAFVYVAAPGAGGAFMAMPVPVRLAFTRGDASFVDAPGLTDGAKVVVEGNERLRPMMPITLIGEAAEGSGR